MSRKIITTLMFTGLLCVAPLSAVAESVNLLTQQAKTDCDDLQKMQTSVLNDVVVSRLPSAEQMPSAQSNKLSPIIESASDMLTALQTGNIFSYLSNKISSKVRETVTSYATSLMMQSLRQAAGGLTNSLGIKSPAINMAINGAIGTVANNAAAAGGAAIQSGVNNSFEAVGKSGVGSAVNTVTGYGDSVGRGVATDVNVYAGKTRSAVNQGYEDFKTQLKLPNPPPSPLPSPSPSPSVPATSQSGSALNSVASWFR